MSQPTDYEHAKYDLEHPLGYDTPRTVAFLRHLADALEQRQVGLRDFTLRRRALMNDVETSHVEFEMINMISYKGAKR